MQGDTLVRMSWDIRRLPIDFSNSPMSWWLVPEKFSKDSRADFEPVKMTMCEIGCSPSYFDCSCYGHDLCFII